MYTPTWKTTLLRWVSWLVLCLGILYDVLIVLNMVMETLSQATEHAQFGGLVESGKRSGFIEMFVYFLTGLLLISLMIILDYHLRAQERKGSLLQRVAALLLIEAGVYLGVEFIFAQQIAIRYEILSLRFPYPLDYGEGPILDQVVHLAHFQSIYANTAATSVPPYTIANYPPLYHLVQVPFVWIFGPAFWYGRVISLLGVLAGGIFIALILYTLTKDWIAAAIGGLTTLCMPQVVSWAPNVRVDQMAFGLSLAGLFCIARWPKKRGGLAAAAALLVAAAYTKQSYALSAPLAAFVWLLGQRQLKHAFTLAGIVFTAGALIFGLLTLVTRGGFFFNIVTANVNRFYWQTVRDTFNNLYTRLPLVLYGCGLFILSGVWGKIRPRGWALVSAYLAGAVLQTITIGKTGSSINYLYELSAAFGLVAGSLVAWPGSKYRWAVGIVMVLMATQVDNMTNWNVSVFQTWNTPKIERQAQMAQLAKIVRDAPGPVLADEDMGLIPLEGKSLYLQPFEYKQIVEAGIWDDRPLAAEIRAQKFPVILIVNPTGWDSFGERWTPRLRAAILENYAVSGKYVDTEVYTPKAR